mgnify:CR=1 FL=1|jgi:hypothetical protein
MGTRKRLIKLKLMSYLLLGLLYSSFFGTSCNSGVNSMEKESYYIVETAGDSCSIYKMIFYQGDCSFRFALSGKCPSLTKENYLEDYSKFILEYKSRLRFNETKTIILEFYEGLKIDAKSVEQLIKMTELASGRSVFLGKQESERIELTIK